MAQIGDIVRYLNDVGGGKIVRIEGNMAFVDDDGFETPVLLRECVVVEKAGSRKAEAKGAGGMTTAAPRIESPQQPQPMAEAELDEEDIAETPEGEVLNVVLAYEPTDIKNLSQTTYDTYLVNDSNYYLYFTYMTRGDGDDASWVVRYAGVVEPNIQVFVGEVRREELGEMERVAVQYIAFKRGRGFRLKAPGAVEYKLDTTKFFKLHCFRENIYFDTPVIAIDVVKNDMPVRPHTVNAAELEKEMRAKRSADRRKPMRRPVVKRKELRRGDVIEVDLHIHELVDSTRGLSAADMLNLQVDEFRRVMDSNLKNKGQKIVFIHGKGEGVLRQALMKELNHRYKGHDVQDASFREYGFGATQVTI